MEKIVGGTLVSAAKHGTVGVCKDVQIGVQEKDFRKGDHERMDRQRRRRKNAGILLDKSQKVLLIGIGEVFPDPQINLLVIGMVQVGQIQGDEDG